MTKKQDGFWHTPEWQFYLFNLYYNEAFALSGGSEWQDCEITNYEASGVLNLESQLSQNLCFYFEFIRENEKHRFKRNIPSQV